MGSQRITTTRFGYDPIYSYSPQPYPAPIQPNSARIQAEAYYYVQRLVWCSQEHDKIIAKKTSRPTSYIQIELHGASEPTVLEVVRCENARLKMPDVRCVHSAVHYGCALLACAACAPRSCGIYIYFGARGSSRSSRTQSCSRSPQLHISRNYLENGVLNAQAGRLYGLPIQVLYIFVGVMLNHTLAVCSIQSRPSVYVQFCASLLGLGLVKPRDLVRLCGWYGATLNASLKIACNQIESVLSYSAAGYQDFRLSREDHDARLNWGNLGWYRWLCGQAILDECIGRPVGGIFVFYCFEGLDIEICCYFKYNCKTKFKIPLEIKTKSNFVAPANLGL